MIAEILTGNVTTFNNKMKSEKMKVLLFVDNCSASPGLEFAKVEIQFFQPNTTSKDEQMDLGILKCLKRNCKNQVNKRCVAALDSGINIEAISTRDCMFMVKKCWEHLSHQLTLSNVFTKRFCSDRFSRCRGDLR